MRKKPYEFLLLDALNAIEDVCVANNSRRKIAINRGPIEEEIRALAVLVDSLAKRMAP